MSGYEAARQDTRRRASQLVDRVLGRGGVGVGASSTGSGVRSGGATMGGGSARNAVRSGGGAKRNTAGYGAPPRGTASSTRTVRNVIKSKRRIADNIELEHGWKNPGLEIGFGKDKYKKPMGTIPCGSAAASPQDRVLQKKRGKANVVGQSKLSQREQDATKLINVFRAFDVNFDGKLQHGEFKRALRYLGVEKKFGTAELDSMITRLDPKDKGFITYQDAVDALEVDHEVHRPTMANEGQITAAPKHKGK